MKKFGKWLSHILLVCLCFSLLTLVSCDKLPLDKLPESVQDILGVEKPVQTPTHEHTISYHEAKAPTCTEGGWLEYECCTTCDAYTTYTAVDPLGHDFSEDFLASGDHHSSFCSRCTESIDEAHVWVTEGTVITAPTCLLGGQQIEFCIVCNAKKTVDTASLGHDYAEEYTSDGDTHSRHCSRCDSVTDTAAHTWQADEYISAPTCDKAGVQAYSCADCSATKQETVNALGHDYSDEFTPNGANHSRKCVRCDATTEAQPHEWTAGEVVKAPTCAEAGAQLYNCSVCGETKTETLDQIDHTYSDVYLPNGDVHSRFCTGCDATVDAEHAWVEGDIITAPTCAEEGKQLYSCSVCNATEERTLPATGEHYDGGWETVRMPTATVRGLERLRCSVCDGIILEREVACDADSMPVLYFTGDYTAATNAKNEVEMGVSFVHPNGQTFEGSAKIKVQGSSSVAYAKKNYTVKLYKDSTFSSKYKVDLGWGKENKYVIKANWVDFSSARNVVSCRLWGDIVASRATSDTQQRLAGLKTNGGAIDGFAVAVYMNGTFHGLYTLNVPKDEWMFDMGDSETEAILGADDWNHTDFNTFIESFYEDASGDIVSKEGGWELVYCGSDDYSWVAESFDALIRFCQENDGDAFRAGISEYLDVDAAIDYIIYMYAICMRDNASKNMLWITYDGKVWTPSVYDQDGTFGQSWDGVNSAAANYCLPKVTSGKVSPNIPFGPNAHPVNFILWDRILNCFTEEVLLRYQYLRQTTLSVSNMIAELQAFEATVPDSIYEADRIRWEADRATWWAGKKGSGVWYEKHHFEYMYQWIENRMTYYDAAMQSIYQNVYLPNTTDPAL